MKSLWDTYKAYLQRCIDNEIEDVLSYDDWLTDLMDWGNYKEAER